MRSPGERIHRHLSNLYKDTGRELCESLELRLDGFRKRNPQLIKQKFELTQKDAILITYGDQFEDDDHSPLVSLEIFLERHLRGLISGLHLLPFYPYSSDDGFSVTDFESVDNRLGTWGDIERLADQFRLMFDVVLNHISSQSAWFKSFVRSEEPYQDYFITIDPEVDLSATFRPRSHPLLTPIETSSGVRCVWTTFSPDQVDLNFKNPKVLFEIIEVILFYIEKGARFIRLDAIGYVWKEVGTLSLNLPQAHEIVKLLRAVLDYIAPQVQLITETNVPHAENIAYFGDILETSPKGSFTRGDEAQLVYNFSLAPLILHAFLNKDARVLSNWARSLATPYHSVAFFNFIASHDGIGVTPARGLLSESDIQKLVNLTLDHGGQVSYKTNPDGSKSVYELNTSLFDALNDPSSANEDEDIRRFIASQAIMLSLAGVPGIYVHSLFGTRNCDSCVQRTGQPRSINRGKFSLPEIESALVDRSSVQTRVFHAYAKLLQIRQDQSAFHPNAPQTILDLDPRLFCVLRIPPKAGEAILSVTNVSPDPIQQRIKRDVHGLDGAILWRDLIGDSSYLAPDGDLELNVDAFQTLWLKAD
jgi:sucrose phosphorylase